MCRGRKPGRRRGRVKPPGRKGYLMTTCAERAAFHTATRDALRAAAQAEAAADRADRAAREAAEAEAALVAATNAARLYRAAAEQAALHAAVAADTAELLADEIPADLGSDDEDADLLEAAMQAHGRAYLAAANARRAAAAARRVKP